MDCWHLTLKELLDALYVCKEHLKLDGEKCVDFIHYTFPPSNKGDSPMQQCAQPMCILVSRPHGGHFLLAAVSPWLLAACWQVRMALWFPWLLCLIT